MGRRSMLVFGSPRIGPDEIEEVVATLRSGWLSAGPKVALFEDLLRRYTGASHAVAVNSCTAGLYLALLAAGVGPQDEVLTSPFTFAATANAILRLGARPVFVDIDPLTLNIDPEGIERAVTPRTKAIVAVHFAGRPCAMEAILGIARRRGIKVVQDAAHALEARRGGKAIARWGDLAAFSFYANKNLTTGEGGVVVTDNPSWARRIRVLAFQGIDQAPWPRFRARGLRPHRVIEAGFKFNMSDLNAALGLHQLRKIGAWLRRRERIWRRYDDAFAGLPLRLPAPAPPHDRHARHLYTVLLDLRALRIDRDQFRLELLKRKIGTGLHYVSLHLQPYYRRAFGFRARDFPNAAQASERIVSLPLSAGLSDRDVSDVIEAVTEVVCAHKR